MRTAHVQIVDDCALARPAELRRVVKVLQRQVSQHFAPAWGIDAELEITRRARIHPDAWVVTLAKTSTAAGDDGWHDLGPHGQPLGIVFLEDALRDSREWTSTASHEVLELLADPALALSAQVDLEHHPRAFAYEVCDPVQGDQCRYELGGIPVSDFVHPAWFEAFHRPGTTFDHRGHCKRPFHLVRGGYTSFTDEDGAFGWREAWWRKGSTGHLHGSRRSRRKKPRASWSKSALQAPR